MSMQKKSKAGFTLVELMVVAIIVAILAAVAIPLMSGNKKRAAATEAEAALGTVRSALRAVLAETGSYNVTPSGGSIANGAAATAVPGINVGDLQGTYWQEANYTISSISASSYVLQATGSTNANASGVTITLNQAGTFSRTGL
jgi:prepilin-type N-terminal cleavage/methylation domain-containing protein